MKLKYIGPHDEVELPNGATVRRNHTIDVADDLAGSPPSPRIAVAMGELRDAVDNRDHLAAVDLRAEIAALDYGSGLLAQDTWEVATTKKEKSDSGSDDVS